MKMKSETTVGNEESLKMVAEGKALATIGNILKELPLHQAQRVIIAVGVLNGMWDHNFGIVAPGDDHEDR